MFTDNERCFFHVAALKYLLAGDLQSAELLTLLEARLRNIPWEDAGFIQFSEEMRAPLPKLTPEQEQELQPLLLPLLHLMAERIAKDNETVGSALSKMKEVVEANKQMMTLQPKLLTFSVKLLEVIRKMKDRLEMLGDDTEGYEIPKEIPKDLWPK